MSYLLSSSFAETQPFVAANQLGMGVSTLRLGSVPRAAARRVNAVEMCPALGSPGKSALIRHTFSGCARGRSLPSSSRIGARIATAVSGAMAALIAGPAEHFPMMQAPAYPMLNPHTQGALLSEPRSRDIHYMSQMRHGSSGSMHERHSTV